LEGFGSNPGNLLAHTYIPHGLADDAALVVVLHGCTQSAAGYDKGSGWSQLADRHGFALLFPEQQRANNPNLCFNWFVPADIKRDQGEALSIRQMIGEIVRTRSIDPGKIFVTGLSAGGAMTSVMLATYPELFAGGAIIAGLPYGSAKSVPQALERMRGQGGPDHADLGALISAASDHPGPWPTISVWHGSGDVTVSPNNAAAIVAQWKKLHGVNREPSRIDLVDGFPRRVWINDAGRTVIEDYSITGMGHGTPLQTGGEDGCGAEAAFMLDVNISSTRHIAAFWGLIDAAVARMPAATSQPSKPIDPIEKRSAVTMPAVSTSWPAPPTGHSDGVTKIIEDALRKAGLMR
jgi:poly(hydroxyalkanoate) depolymerase family esterase